MPTLTGMRFATAIIARHKRCEAFAGEAMIEMCLAGASAGHIEDASEALRGSSVSAATACQRADVHWRQGRRHDRRYRRGVSGLGLPEMRRAFLSQRAGRGGEVEKIPGSGDREGDLCSGILRGQHGEVGGRGRQFGEGEALGSCQVRATASPRRSPVPGFPCGTGGASASTTPSSG